MINENFLPEETQVVFLHGLESNEMSDKAKWLKSNFNTWAPKIDYKNPHVFQDLYNEIVRRNPRLIVGSSMGGWFAYAISTLTGIRTLLLNPAVHSRSMEPKGVHLGKTPSNHVVVLGKNDDLINPNVTKGWFAKNGIGEFHFNDENIGHRTPTAIMTKYIDRAINEDWSTESPGDGAAINILPESVIDNLRQNFMASRPAPGTLTVEELKIVSNYTKNRNAEDERLAISVKESPVDEFYKWLIVRGQKIKRSEIEEIWANKILIKLTDDLKDYYKRPRPYWLSGDIIPVSGTEKSSWSFPSGHATGAYLIAIELTKKYPHLEAGLFSLAQNISLARVKSGVHYPSDIEGGRELAYLISEKI
jgi:hypothetical protein